MNVLQKIARRLSDDQLVSNLNRLNETLDSFVAEGLTKDPESEASFQRDLKVRDALRNEYRTRTGEII
jgi:hypothetical protein